jgi:CO/xanthine dehydrogenase FAD-binding subunit
VQRREYYDPDTLEEILALLAKYGDDAKLVAGGQSLMVMLRQGLIEPATLIDLNRVRELAQLKLGASDSRMGSMVTARTLERDRVVQRKWRVVAEAAAAVGPLQVRNMGTVGGSVAHNALGADLPVALVALDAVAVVKTSVAARTLAVEHLLTGYFETALQPDEVLTEIVVPSVPAHAASAYVKFAPRVVDMALVSVAVVVGRTNQRVDDVRIAVGGAAPMPFRARQAEALLRGAVGDVDLFEEAGRLGALDASPPSDHHGSAGYRRWLVRVLVTRALHRVWAEAAA